MRESMKEKLELVAEAGMQGIPVVGGPLASIYFGNKQNKRFARIEEFYKEVSEELDSVREKIASVNSHDEDELSAILEELNNNIENEYLKSKIVLYKNYFKNTMIYPVNSNYSERKLLLNIAKELSPLEMELIVFLEKQVNSIIDTTITKPGVENSVIQGSIAKIKILGLLDVSLNSIVIGDNNGSTNEKIKLNKLGRKFHDFCMKFEI